jgi:hypothetical protein
MTPQEERNKRFDEIWSKWNYGNMGKDEFQSHLTSEVNLTIEQVERWAGENKYADGCTGTGEDCGSKKYNQALDDLLSFLTTLKK